MPSVSFKVNPEYAEITEVIPGLFICGVTALTAKNMEKYNITLIINATHEESFHFFFNYTFQSHIKASSQIEVPNFKALGNIQRIKLWIEDTSQTDILSHFENISDHIHAELTVSGNVLIHCVAGVSRSAALCLAYLTKYKCKSLREAYHLMASKRPMVRPVLGFWEQLITYEQEIKKIPASVRLIADETQAEKLLPDVYLKHVLPEPSTHSNNPITAKDEKYQKILTGTKRKFQPVLETLAETVEQATFPQLNGNMQLPLQNCENFNTRKCHISELSFPDKK